MRTKENKETIIKMKETSLYEEEKTKTI